MIFGRKKKFIEHEMCVLIFPTTFLWNISCCKKNSARYYQKICVVLHIKYTLFTSDFNQAWIFLTFKKPSNIKFCENASSGSQIVPCGETDGHTDMTKLIVTCCIFVNTSNKKGWVGVTCSSCRRNVEWMLNFWGNYKGRVTLKTWSLMKM